MARHGPGPANGDMDGLEHLNQGRRGERQVTTYGPSFLDWVDGVRKDMMVANDERHRTVQAWLDDSVVMRIGLLVVLSLALLYVARGLWKWMRQT